MEESKYVIFGLFWTAMVLMFFCGGSIIWLSKNKPYTPKFTIEAVSLQDFNKSSDEATADWNFNFLIKNMNEFGWSYHGFTATLYNDGIYDYSHGATVPFYATHTIVPAFSQGKYNETIFTARFEGVSVPITNKLMSNQGSGGNSQVFDVPVELTLKGKIEPVPKRSSSKIIRWLASPIHVDCKKVKIGVSIDSTGAIRVYLGRGSYCSSRWDSFLLV